MSTNETKPVAATKRGWLKKLLFLFGGLIVLLVIAFFVVTSDAFFKGTILPQVGKAMNATLTAESASLSPFSQVRIQGLKLQTTGTEPLLTLKEFKARYQLTAILAGTLKVDEVLIDSPTVTVVVNADGTSNLDPLSEGQSKETKPAAAPAKSGKPPQVDLKQFKLNNATVRYIKHHTGGTQDTVELTGVNLTLDDLKNGTAGKLAFALELNADMNPPDATQRGVLHVKHDGNYTFTLGSDLMPSQISGSDRTDVTQATGAMEQLAGFGADLAVEMSPTEIKTVALTFRKATTALGELRLSGPFDAMKREGKLTLTLVGIDRKLLNLAGEMAGGLDFGTTAIYSTNTIDITKGGALIALGGRFGIADLQVTRASQTTPTLQFTTDYGLNVDTEKNSAQLQTLNLNGQQNGRPMLKSALSAPMTIAWGNNAQAVGDSTLTLNLMELNLAEWKSFMGDAIASGNVSAALKLVSQAAGKKISFEVGSQIADLATGDAANPISGLALNLTAKGTATDLQKFEVSEYKLDAKHREQLLLDASGSASFDQASGDATAKLDARAFLIPLMNLQPQTNAPLKSGTVSFNTSVTQKGKEQTVSGTLTAADLVSVNGTNEIRLPNTTAEFNIVKTGEVIELKKVQAKLAPSDRAKNEIALTGRVDMSQTNAITGALKLAAESLDFTSYYDLFMANPSTATAEAKPAPAPTPAPGEEKEPDAMTLPVRNFTFETAIGHIYLHEIDVADIQVNTKLDGSDVSVKPMKCTLNGAPITGALALDLSVPGYKYEFDFDAKSIPLAPLVNSVAPDRKGQVDGTATAFVAIKGAGTTGASLQKNLNGKFDVVATNLNLSLGNVRSPVIKSVINILVTIPDAIRNPTAALGSLLSSVTGSKKESSGWVDEFMKSPLNALVVHGTAGSGNIELQECSIASAAFHGDVTGKIEIAPVLTNSVMDFPVSLALGKSLSDQIGLTPGSTPTNAVYVPLPDFVRMGGTLGVPKPDVKYLVLAQLALKSGAGIGQNIGGAAGDAASGILGSVGGLLGGGKSTETNTPGTTATNAPASSPASDLIKGIGGLFGGGKKAAKTNGPATAPK